MGARNAPRLRPIVSLPVGGVSMMPLRIFIGYDSREPAAFAVVVHSILSRASIPVAITPLTLQSVRRLYSRQRGPTESTEFSLTRFLVPALCGFKGHAIFMDCDMLCRVDIGDLQLPILADPGKAVYCCQHDYTPRSGAKFMGQTQTTYPKKNWSSLMAFDCSKCLALTPEYVNTAPGLALHRFQWTDDASVGALPLAWNWLVGEYEPNPNAYILHYTLGGPWFDETNDCDHADLWRAEADATMHARQAVSA